MSSQQRLGAVRSSRLQGGSIRVDFSPAMGVSLVLAFGVLFFGAFSIISWFYIQALWQFYFFLGLAVAEGIGLFMFLRRFQRLTISERNVTVEGRAVRRFQESFPRSQLDVQIKRYRVRGFEYYTVVLIDQQSGRVHEIQGQRRFHRNEAEFLRGILTTVET